MLTVNIGIRHNYYFVVSDFCYIKLVADTRSECKNNGCKLIVSDNLVNSCLFDIEHFTPKRKYCLNTVVSAFFCRAARRISLDDKQFCVFGILVYTVGKLTGKRVALKRRLSSCRISCFSCRLSRS